MFSVRHLQQKREELQQQYDLLSEKIGFLRNKYAIEAGTLVAFQLDKEIELVEKERDRLLKQILTIEKSCESERIHSELFRLNYIAQVQLFREFITEKRIGAFLVHGSPEHGQIWLLKRLLQKIPESTVTPPISFHLSRRVLRTDIAALWRELGRQMGVQDYSSQQEIARNVVAQLKTQHIILIFHDLDCIDEIYLQELIRDFWLPLVNSTPQTICPSSEFFLLMFLVDCDGCVNTWNLGFADRLDLLWKPHIPIRLPMIDPLSKQVLVNWMENAIDVLPIEATRKIDYTVQIILEKSEGIPERVFAQIFGLCGCNWEEEEVKWLEL
ncbi:hypothetical protein I8752_03200 [Nostocaceae cyanobacterium CENA369]|uniref:Inactive STAND domain-containing protein n=1 Tax=Dendronalium phyllosphericum CENA369 TaxID=1725256 RepID=A0A8J7HXK5_9NOST|nr:hypothetical protein [Dendronalium phyllosphericum]MBH8572054.1 hypothetical protein [Dendronalium phyllosphericum CENA369]